jgi:hypothetical protein
MLQQLRRFFDRLKVRNPSLPVVFRFRNNTDKSAERNCNALLQPNRVFGERIARGIRAVFSRDASTPVCDRRLPSNCTEHAKRT